jgi:hypothetical protein
LISAFDGEAHMKMFSGGARPHSRPVYAVLAAIIGAGALTGCVV